MNMISICLQTNEKRLLVATQTASRLNRLTAFEIVTCN